MAVAELDLSFFSSRRAVGACEFLIFGDVQSLRAWSFLLQSVVTKTVLWRCRRYAIRPDTAEIFKLEKSIRGVFQHPRVAVHQGFREGEAGR